MSDDVPNVPAMAYVAKHACGGMLGAVVDNPEHRKDVSRTLRSWSMWKEFGDTITIERVTVEVVRTMAFCDHFPEPPPPPPCGRKGCGHEKERYHTITLKRTSASRCLVPGCKCLGYVRPKTRPVVVAGAV